MEKENARLKRLLADRMREVDALKQLLGKKYAHRGTTGGGVRAGVLVELQRASLHYQPRSIAEDGVSTEIAALAQAHPRHGYRRITQRVPGAAAAQIPDQLQARASAVEACPRAGAAIKPPTAAP